MPITQRIPLLLAISFLLFFLLFSLDSMGSFAGTKGLDDLNPDKRPPGRHTVKFIENRGQMIDAAGKPVPFVLFKAEAPGADIYINESGITYVFFSYPAEEHQEEEKNNLQFLPERKKKKKLLSAERIDMRLAGANIYKENIIAENVQQGERNFFLPHCPEGIYGVKSYGKITIKNVYPGIDWVLYNSEKNGFKYDFVVHPGADYKQIALLYTSRNPVVMDSTGDISVTHHLGNLAEKAPFTYLGNAQTPLKSAFEMKSQTEKGEVFESLLTFNLETHKQGSEDLVIDPQLVWSTFFGGNGQDGIMAIDTDPSGNLFMTGYNDYGNFPLHNAGTYFQTTFGTFRIIVIVKFSSSGALLWSTYYGGTSGGINQTGWALTTDQNGNLFVTGSAGTNFPVMNSGGYFQTTGTSFILKFNNNGLRLWATCYGGSISDISRAIACDPSGNIYLTGVSYSNDFPLQNAGGFFQASKAATTSAFFLKFNNNGTRLWSTYFGDGNMYGTGIACDQNGNLFFATTVPQSTITLPLVNAGGGSYFQATPQGGHDVIIGKFSANGTLAWSTFYGGSSGDYSGQIITDHQGNLFLMGMTSSTDFPVQNAGTYFQGTLASQRNIFILKFNNNGVRQWATFYGGTSICSLGSTDNIAVDTCGNIFVSYNTASGGSPTKASCDSKYIDFFSGIGRDAVILWFSNTGDLKWATYLGGERDDFREALATDPSGNLFVAGEWNTQSWDTVSYPRVNPSGGAYFQPGPNGGDESFVAKFRVPETLDAQNYFLYPPICLNGTVSPIITPTIVTGNGTFSSSPGLNLDPGSGAITVSASIPGTYVINYSGFVPCGCLSSASDTIVLSVPANVSVSNATICSGATATLIATAAPSAGASYSWNVTGGNTASLVVNPLINSVYQVSVTNVNGCITTTTVNVLVNNNPTLAVAGNTMVCVGESVNQSASGAQSYLWSTGATSSQIVITPTSSSTYTVTGTGANGCSGTATVNLHVKPLPQYTVTPDTICEGNSAQLYISSDNPQVTYTWFPSGITSSSLIVVPPFDKYYYVFADLNGCAVTDSTHIAELPLVHPNITFNYNNPFCFPKHQQALPLLVPNFMNDGIYSSVDGLVIASTSGQVNLQHSNPGTYTVSYHRAAQGCTLGGTSSATLVIEEPINLSLTKNKKIPPGGSAALEVSGAATFTWIPDEWLSCFHCSEVIVNPPAKTEYCVMSQRGACTASACVTIDVGCRTIYELDVPNAFTPNGDARNDRFCLKGWQDCLVSFHLMVFNRWGEKVFESTDPAQCWDGTYKGQMLNTGVFVYSLNADFEDGSKINRKGNITLIR